MAPFEAFLEAYSQHPAGCEHELVLLFNGFLGSAELAPYRERAAALMPREVMLHERCQDLSAYSLAARSLEHDRLCFLNSYSRVLADGWLAALDAALDDPSVGVAGATGSWASQRDYLAYQLGVPSGYARVFPDRADARRAFRAIDGTADRGWALHKAGTALDWARRVRGFTGFPAPHLRTNAFMADRDLLLAVAPPPLQGKLDAHRFESGRASMTARVQELGLRCVVVGRDGISYDPEAWPASHTFSQGDQENLLVADNRTSLYAASGACGRRYLSWLAWGEQARPG